MDFNRVIRMNPENPWPYYLRGECNALLYGAPGVLEDYRKALELGPEIPFFHLNMGLTRAAIQDYEGAIGYVNNAIKADSTYAYAYFVRGNCKVRIKDITGALADYDTVTKLAPKVPDVWINKGRLYLFDLKNYEKSIFCFTTAIPLDSLNVNCFYLRGKAYLEFGKNAEAIEDFSKCIALNPDILHAYFFRAMSRDQEKEARWALQDYDYIINFEGKAKRDFEYLASTYNNKACCHITLGEYKTALLAVTKALKLDPGEAYILDTRGQVYYYLGEYQKAIADMDTAITMKSTDSYVSHYSFYYRGLSKVKLGDTEAGLRDLAKAEELGSPTAHDKIREITGK